YGLHRADRSPRRGEFAARRGVWIGDGIVRRGAILDRAAPRDRPARHPVTARRVPPAGRIRGRGPGVSGPLDYRSAGVDIDAADDAKHRIRRLVESTWTAGARGAFGGFGGMFRVPTGYERPVLVASA